MGLVTSWFNIHHSVKLREALADRIMGEDRNSLAP